jgi:hypothetical protein
MLPIAMAGTAPPPAAPAAAVVADDPALLAEPPPAPALSDALGVVLDPLLPAAAAVPLLLGVVPELPALGVDPLPLVAALELGAELPEAWALSMPVVVLLLPPPPHAASTGKSESEPKMTDLMVGPHTENRRRTQRAE